jgi:hypothetical protein
MAVGVSITLVLVEIESRRDVLRNATGYGIACGIP